MGMIVVTSLGYDIHERHLSLAEIPMLQELELRGNSYMIPLESTL